MSHDGTVPSEGSDSCRRSPGVVWVFPVYSVGGSGPAPSCCHVWGENSDRTGRGPGLIRDLVLMHSHIVLFSMCRVPYVVAIFTIFCPSWLLLMAKIQSTTRT